MKLTLALAATAMLVLTPAASAAGDRNWVVTFTVTQSGLPDRPKPPPELTATTTTARGKVFFKKKPKEGQTTRGQVTGRLRHNDTFGSKGEQFTMRIRGKGGFTYAASGKASLFLPGKVKRRTGTSDRFGVKKGAKGIARLGDLPAGDTLSFITYGKEGAKHTHAFAPGATNTLEIVIGRPKRV